jgi:hypothetical protein
MEGNGRGDRAASVPCRGGGRRPSRRQRRCWPKAAAGSLSRGGRWKLWVAGWASRPNATGPAVGQRPNAIGLAWYGQKEEVGSKWKLGPNAEKE